LEQKINNNASLGVGDKAEFQAQLTKCYGSLTTFNFLFNDAGERFRGSGS
jgi:superoxide dismutase